MNSSILLYNMKDNVQSSKKAIELRRLGLSYADISIELKVSKTSVSNWVKNVRLTESEKINLQKNLKSKMERGRMKASISIRSKKVFKEKVAYENAEKEFQKHVKDPFFMLGLGIYGFHSQKKANSFQFMSSDLPRVKTMLAWMEKYLNLSLKIPKYRLFINFTHEKMECEQYWAKNLDISSELFQKTIYLRSQKHKEDREYKGSLAIIVPKIEVIRKVIAWQKLAMRYYS